MVINYFKLWIKFFTSHWFNILVKLLFRTIINNYFIGLIWSECGLKASQQLWGSAAGHVTRSTQEDESLRGSSCRTPADSPTLLSVCLAATRSASVNTKPTSWSGSRASGSVRSNGAWTGRSCCLSGERKYFTPTHLPAGSCRTFCCTFTGSVIPLHCWTVLKPTH